MPRVAIVFVVLAAAFLPGATLAQVDPGTLIIAGAGWGGNWDTEIELADSPLGVGTSGGIFKVNSILAPCPPNCDTVAFTVPPGGTVRILVSDFLGEFFQGPQTLRVTTATEQPLPVVRARVFNSLLPCQSAELPVFRESTLAGLDTSVLVFAGLRRQPGVYSNLILQNVGTQGAAEALVEMLAADGALLGSEVVTVPVEDTALALTLVDVAGRLGASQLDGGSIRVTRRSGEGVLWGVLATVYADGRLAVGIGANP
ncbi:MAG: hypothetical protein WEB59_07630 [Thermoanaerobaculia bacterium]